MIGAAPAMQKVFEIIRNVATTSATMTDVPRCFRNAVMNGVDGSTRAITRPPARAT